MRTRINCRRRGNAAAGASIVFFVLVAFVVFQERSVSFAWVTVRSASKTFATHSRFVFEGVSQYRLRLSSVSDSRIPVGYETPLYPVPRQIDEALLGDLTGGRPGAIIETEEQLVTKDLIQQEIDNGNRLCPSFFDDYGNLIEDEEAEYDIDDPDTIDASTLGTWTIQDLRSRFPYEWNPLAGEPDPNLVQLLQDDMRYLKETEKDDDGVEVGYDPVFGPSNPMDTRTILGAVDSYMIDKVTRDDAMLSPQFPTTTDPEIRYNEDVVQFRKSLDILETYVDPFLPDTLPIPRRVARWYGYPEPMYLPPKNFTNNRFTDADQLTDFDAMTPYEARIRAVELARSKNAEWLPDGVSQAWHRTQRAPYEHYGTLVGTLRPGECDPELVELIQPALAVLGSCCQLLSIESSSNGGSGESSSSGSSSDRTIYRFAYHGLMKNRYGMQCWTETLLQECGVTVTGVIMETGFRRRDAPYDGGDPWYGPSF